jgi:rRNA maturation protein Nop10
VWECRKCHEKHEDTFEVCWKCGTALDGTEDPTFRRADDTDAGSEGAAPLDFARLSPAERQARFLENPGALLFKGTHSGTLSASICGQCGYTELYVSNPAELLAAYRRSKLAK